MPDRALGARQAAEGHRRVRAAERARGHRGVQHGAVYEVQGVFEGGGAGYDRGGAQGADGSEDS